MNMFPTIFEVAERAARKLRGQPAGRKPRKAGKTRPVTRRKHAERGSGRVRKSKRKTGR